MRTSLLALLGALTLAVAAVAGNGIRFAVSPVSVAPAGAVRISGNAGSCPVGDTVAAISRAFPGDAFGAAGALSGQVRVGGAFTIDGHLRVRLKVGRYAVTARCGGGNLGKVAYLRVR